MARPPERYKKITLNVFREDVETIKKHYPSWGGWTAVIRQTLHTLADRLRALEQHTKGR